MKLGIQTNVSSTENELETNVDTPSSDPPFKTTTENNAPAATDDLDLGVLSKEVDGETIMGDLQKPSTEENVDLAARLNIQATAEEAEVPVSAPVQEPIELLRLLRDPQSGQLIVEVGGQQYTKLADITDKKIGQFVLKLAAHFLAFTNGVVVTNAGMKNLGMPKVDSVPEPVVDSVPPVQPEPDLPPPLVPKPPPEAEAAFLASIQSMPLSEPAQRQKTGSFFSFGKSSTSSVETASGGFELNLAEEINEIVQNRLRYSPLAENYRVDIQTEPSGGIRIVVNDQIYASADDVQDTEIRDLIKASIKEWEDR